MTLLTERYEIQAAQWPKTGRHILAQYDSDSIVVYQAYNAEIGHFAAEHGYFGGVFSLSRMSWHKPNFLWMMYRAGWATKPNQEVILAVRLQRAAFDEMLRLAIHSSYVSAVYGNEKAWQTAVTRSTVRLQWDPDHHPAGSKLERRAIQLGLRGVTLAQYAREWIMGIDDISEFVHEQYTYVQSGRYDALITPLETVYPVTDQMVAQKLGLS